MRNFFQLLIIFSVSFAIRQGMQKHGSKANLPNGVLAMVETPDGKSSVTVYKDKITTLGPAIKGSPHTIYGRDITKVDVIGTSLWITAKDSMLTLSFDGWSKKEVNNMKDAIQDMIARN